VEALLHPPPALHAPHGAGEQAPWVNVFSPLAAAAGIHVPLAALLPPPMLLAAMALPHLPRALQHFEDVALLPCDWAEAAGAGALLLAHRLLLAARCPPLAALLCPATWAAPTSAGGSGGAPQHPTLPTIAVGIPRAPLAALLH
jgi:hypothetical protein